MFFPGCISYLPRQLPWGTGAEEDQHFSVAMDMICLLHFSPSSGNSSLALLQPFFWKLPEPYNKCLGWHYEREGRNMGGTVGNSLDKPFLGQTWPKASFVFEQGSSCLSLQANSFLWQQQVTSKEQLAGGASASVVLAWQVLASRPSAHRINPVSAMADYIWQREGYSEQPLFANSCLPVPCFGSIPPSIPNICPPLPSTSQAKHVLGSFSDTVQAVTDLVASTGSKVKPQLSHVHLFFCIHQIYLLAKQLY